MNAVLRAITVTAAVAGLGLGLLACGGQSSSNTNPPPPTLSVGSASPSSGAQGTASLAITITGAGFASGTTARFFRTGTTDPAGITVRSTSYVSATQLVATIDIGGTATVAQFDIQVQLTDGRSASGSARFGVTARPVDLCTEAPAPASSAYLAGPPGHPGYLDSTFGAGTGRVLGPPGFFVRGGRGSAALQDVGGETRIVNSGSFGTDCRSNDPSRGAVARYLPNGQLDGSFGTSGIAWAPEAVHDLGAVAIDGAGRIIAAGSFLSPDIVRFSRDGAVDTAFGTSGVVILQSVDPGTVYVSAVAIQPDDKIVITGSWYPAGGPTSHLLVSRLNVDGTPDTTFNGTGQYAFVDAQSHGYGVAIQHVGTEDRILVAGAVQTAGSSGENIGAVWRLTPSGSLDSTFGTGGIATGNGSNYLRVARDGTGIVAVGEWHPSSNVTVQPTLARFTENGALDPSFGQGGLIQLDTPTRTGTCDVAVEADGHILVVGYTYNAARTFFSMVAWRFTAAGVLDAAFGNNGSIVDSIVDQASAEPVALFPMPDGTFVTAGELRVQLAYYGFLARFWQ